jgi:predicted nucleotidyltransferase
MKTPAQRADRSAAELRQKLAELLCADARVAFAYLFGSRAVGLERQDSDVDLAIYYAHPPGLWEALRFQEELSEAVGLPVQVVSLNSQIRPSFLRAILDQGISLKDSSQRAEWARDIEHFLEMREEGMKKDPRRPLLDSLKEKIHLLGQVLPKRRGLDLARVRAGDIDEQARFVGLFMTLYEPTEAALRKAAALIALEEKGRPPASLTRVIEKVRQPLNLNEETLAILRALKPLRDTMAHAYWEISTEVLQKFDKAAVESGMRELQGALANYVLEQERILEGKGLGDRIP